MISLASSAGEVIQRLSGDVYGGMVRSLAEGYGTGYPFCRFYIQDGGAVISYYYGSGTVCCPENISGEKADELTDFISSGIFGKLLVPGHLHGLIPAGLNVRRLYLMTGTDDIKKYDDMPKDSAGPQISLGEISEIVSGGFDIDRDTWYTDTSHMLRHGIARIYHVGNAACALRMFAYGGTAYVSYVCTRQELRGRGYARRLMELICTSESEDGNTVCLFCGEELKPFYTALGFICTGEAVETMTEQ